MRQLLRNYAPFSSGRILNGIMLKRLKTAVDKKMSDRQSGFRQERSCIDQITTLRIIIEQSLEWNSSLCTTHVHFEKAFDSLHRESLWKLPEKFIAIVKSTYDGMSRKL